ncbi:macrophage erythroblast attacher-like [Iris pallida]|uniref:Macrophage erythroblast attacher-like n=1 Tax=Iris pallida TaxID=29817 RepID=A0AAX6ILT0_IRIPA|nr:macrophage erythroblast attacher-like [Iris pallida]
MDMDSTSSPPNGAPSAAAAVSAATDAAATSARLAHLADSLKLEYQFLRVPLEHFRKTIRTNHRSAEREVAAVLSGVGPAAEGLSREDAVVHLNSLVSRLQGLKRKSKFEFQLRLQEFIEMVRNDDSISAIDYARKYLAPWGATYTKELQRVMAALAFKSNTECDTYRVLFEPKQWDYLVETVQAGIL